MGGCLIRARGHGGSNPPSAGGSPQTNYTHNGTCDSDWHHILVEIGKQIADSEGSSYIMFWDNGEWSMASSGIADQILPIPGQWNDAGGAYGPMYGGNISKQAFAWPFHTGPETKILLGTQTTDGNKTNADGLRKWSQNRKMADIRITKGRHPYLSDQYEKPSDRV